MFLLRFFLYFMFSFTILSLPINKRPLFSHIYHYTAPYSSQLFANLSGKLKDGIEKSKKTFINSTPNEAHTDSVISSQSSTLDQEDFDNYTNEEKEILKKVLKKAQY